jgi:dimethylhistidine N-methyltransferase
MAKPASTLHWITERAVRHGATLLNRLDPNSAAEHAALLAGLLATPAVISPKYFYDALGCTLFEAICALPEYYPTRTERAILSVHRDDIVRAAGTRKQMVDLGAGDCAKAALLLPTLQPRRFVAVDIAVEAIGPALARLAPAFPGIELIGVVTDFSQRLDLADAIDEGPVTFFYPGSSIGNFRPDEALELLGRVRQLCGSASGLLIGVDTKKDTARLNAAYNDVLGVTAAFNRNILSHVNAVADCDFDPSAFAHVAFYDAASGRIEMHLEAGSTQRVKCDGRERVFAAGERIHTENSYKYAPNEFSTLLRRAGFTDIALWQDDAGDFAVYYAE